MINHEKQQHTILVVDDDPEVLQVIVEGLELRGLTVFHSREAKTALEFQRLHQIKYVLLDMNLGTEHWNGISLGKQLCDNDQEIAVMIMTGYPDMEMMLPLIREQHFGYLMKPFRLEQVLIWLDQCHFVEETVAENRALRERLRDSMAEVDELRKQLEDREGDHKPQPRISTLDPIKGQKPNQYLIDSYKKNSR